MVLWKRDVDWVSEAAERIGCCGLAGWLPGFAAWAELTPTACPPLKNVRKMDYASQRGLELTLLHPFADRTSSVDPQDWVLYDLEIDASVLPLPLRLDASNETPQGARRKLGHDTASGRSVDFRDGNHRIVHYLPDGRVIGVRFRPSLVGIESLHLQRLTVMPDFRTMSAP